MILDKTGTFEILNRTDYAGPDCNFTKAEITTNLQKINEMVAIVRRNQVLSAMKGFDGRARIYTSIACQWDGFYGVPVRISFESGASGSCYVIHTGSANQCSCAADGSAICQGNAEAERSVRFDASGALSIKSNSRSMLFDPLKGTSTPTATIQLTARSGAVIHQVMNIMGRVRSCSPAPALSGYKRC